MTLVDTSVWLRSCGIAQRPSLEFFASAFEGEIYALSDQRQLEFPGLKCLHILPIM